MSDVGTGFWRLVIIGAVGLVPILAVTLAASDTAVASLVQLLTAIPSAALFAAAGAVRAGRPPSVAESYRRAFARLLHYFLSELLVSALILVVVIVPLLGIAIAIGFAAAGAATDASLTAAAVLLLMLAAAVPASYIAARLALVGPLIVVEGLDVGEAITESWQRARRQVLRLLVVFVAGSIPGVLVALGTTLLAFGLTSEPGLIGLAFGLGVTVLVVVVTCVNVVAWERLGGVVAESPGPATSPALPVPGETPRSDRGPATSILLLVVGLALVIGGSVAATGKIGGWIGSLGGQGDGEITYGVNGLGCLQFEERIEFEAGEVVHLVAALRQAIPAGERLAYEVYADGELIDRGFEPPFTEETACIFVDLDTSDIEPAAYTFRYLWGVDVLAEGTFTIRP